MIHARSTGGRQERTCQERLWASALRPRLCENSARLIGQAAFSMARVGSGHPAIALSVGATPATAMARFML